MHPLTGALKLGWDIEFLAFTELLALFDSGVITNVHDVLLISLAVTCDQHTAPWHLLYCSATV